MLTKCQVFLAVLLTVAFATFAVAQGDVVDVVDDVVVNNDNVVDVVDDNASVAEESQETTTTTTQTPRRAIDLDRLLEDDEYTDIFEDEPDVAVADSLDETIAQGGESDTSNIATVDPEHADSIAANERITNAIENITTPPVVVNRAALEGDPIIEDGRTINFAQNLSGYRSPRVAMLLSLLVPGLGQWYARNNTKAAAFAGVEVAGIVTAIALNATANSKRDEAYRFADNNFSVDKLYDYARRLENEFDERTPLIELEDGNSIPDTLWTSVMTTALEPYLTLTMREDSSYYFREGDFFDAARNRSTFFYTSIGGMDYTPGWIEDMNGDARNEPSFDEIFRMDSETRFVGEFGTYQLFEPDFEPWFYLITRTVDGAVRNERIRGYSNKQEEYNDMIDEANSYRDAVNYVFYAMILNRIVSAIDAGFTARSYNARLLNEETVFDRISVEQQFVFTGKEVSPGIALRIRF